MSAQTVLILSALATVSPNLSLAKALAYASAVAQVLPEPSPVPFSWERATVAERAQQVESTIPEALQALANGRKIEAIKIVRQRVQDQGFPMGLKEAKDVVDTLSPTHFVSDVFSCCGSRRAHGHTYGCYNY